MKGFRGVVDGFVVIQCEIDNEYVSARIYFQFYGDSVECC